MKKTKILSAAIALSMSLTCLPVMASTASENLVTDGSFEFYEPTANGWTSGGRVPGARRGDYCIAMEGWAFKTVDGLEPNTDYLLTGWIRNENGDARLGVKDYGYDETQVIISSATYSEQKVMFHTGSTNTSATIFIGSAGGAIYADDISITKVNPGESLLLNSDCESANAPISGASIINDTSKVRSGNGAMKVSAGSWPSQKFGPLEPNTTYSLSAWLKVSNGIGYMKASEYDATGDTGTMSGIPAGDEYQFLNLLFTTDSTNLYPRIWFGAPEGDVYVDDICLTKYTNTDNMFLDNNFERVEGKLGFGDPTGIDYEHQRSGKACLAVPSGWANGNATLEPNTSYVFSGYYRQSAGTVFLPTAKVDGVDNQLWIENDTNGGYNQFNIYFTTGINTTTGQFFLGKADGNAVTYVDDLCLRKLGNGYDGNLITNSDFELGYTPGWTSNGFSREQAHTGNISMLNNNGDWRFYNVIGLEPNTLYEYSLWIKNEVDNDFTYYGVKNYNAEGTDSLKGTPAESGWKQSKAYFKTGANNTTAEIYIGKSGALGAAYIDDVVVKKVNASLDGNIKVYSTGVTASNEITDIKLKDGMLWIQADMTDYNLDYDGKIDIYAAVYYDGTLENLEKATEDDLYTYSDGTKDILFGTTIDATDKDLSKYELKVMAWADLMTPRAETVKVGSTLD